MAYTDNLYTVVVESNGDIFEMAGYQKGKKLGIDIREEAKYIKALEEMQEPLDSYYNKLKEIRQYLIDKYDDKDMVKQLDPFAPVKSPEQIAKEAADLQTRLAQEAYQKQLKVSQEQSEIIKKQSEAMAEMLSLLQSMKKEREQSNGNDRHDTGRTDESSRETSGSDSESNRKESTASKVRAATGTKSIT